MKTFKSFREDEAAAGTPANNIGSGNIASRDIPLFTKPKVKIVGPDPVTPETFSDKIYRRSKPVGESEASRMRDRMKEHFKTQLRKQNAREAGRTKLKANQPKNFLQRILSQ